MNLVSISRSLCKLSLVLLMIMFSSNVFAQAPSISTNPATDTICVGGNKVFSVVASNTTSYQWQLNTGSSWSNVSNGGVYGGATTANLSITSATSGMNNYQYRCICTGSTSPAATSNAATLVVRALPTITSVTSGTVCSGQTGQVSAVASSPASVSWHSASTGGAELATGSTYTVPTASSTATYYAQALVSYGGGADTVKTLFNSNNGQRGAMFDVVAGSKAITVTNFDVSIYPGTTAGYEVYYRPSTYVGYENSSTGWTNLGSASSVTSLGSNVATPLPINFSVTIPANTRYAFYITNDFGGGTNYTDTGTVGNFWAGNSDATIYTGVGKSYPFGLTFTPRSINAVMHYTTGNGCISAVRTGATLTVNPQPNITVNPSNSSIASGGNTNFGITATSTTSYVWQVSTNSGSTWSNVSNGGIYSNATTATLNLTNATSTQNGYQYRAIANNAGGCADTSTAATLSITGSAPSISSHPANSAICSGANASFTVAASGTSLTYQWQVSTNSGSSWSNLSNNGIYTNTTSATLNLTAATTAVNTYQYRCVVTGSVSPPATSNGATLTVNSAPSVTVQPSNSTIGAGSNTSFSVTATGTSLTYVWQVSINSGSTWSNLSNGGIYSNVTTATLNLTAATASYNTYQYRCVVSGTCSPSANSTAATLTVNSAPAITAQPSNSAICDGANTTFSVTATNATAYQWQVSTNSGSSWSNLSNTGIYSGTATATLTLTAATATNNGYQYRCEVTGLTTPNAISNSATLTINAAPIVTVQPSNSTICSGANTTFSVTATGAGLTYQWQVSTNSGSTWSSLSNTGIYTNATTNTLTLTAATTAVNSNQYRCVVSGTCTPSANSNAATLTINSLPVITVQPSANAICSGANTSFSVTATGTGIIYQWQVNNGSTWSNVSNTGIYTGATTNTLTLTAATSAVNSYQYRCVVSGTCTPSATSNAATLTINTAPVITLQPANTTTCDGSNASFGVTATGAGLTYQWQVSSNSGSSWSNISNTGIYTGTSTNTLNLTGATSAVDGYQYRCIVSGTCTPSATSTAASISINSLLTISTHPAASSICSGSNTTFTVAASGTGLTYQWQASTNGGSSWSNLSNTGIYTNTTAATLNLTAATTGENGNQYRCVVTSSCTSPTNSNAATLTINAIPAVTAQPSNSTICNGANTTFSISATGVGLTYQWQVNNGSTWSNVTNTGIYSDATTNTLSLTAATPTVNSYQYRCVVSGTCTPSATSNAATLTINTAPVITLQPANTTTCDGSNASFGVTATGAGLTYQWQVSSNSGSNWSNLSNTGIYTGTSTNTLNLTGATSAVNAYQYRCVVSGTCTPFATTSAATLTINSTLSITTQPTNSTICSGGNTTFSVVASAAGLTYQWQEYNGTSWTNLSNTGIYSGVTSSSLTLTAATTAVNGYQYRCVMNSTCTGTSNSNSGTLTINVAPTISSQPINSTICEGTNTSFTVAATGTGLTYQWQVNNGSAWSSVTNTGIYNGATTSILFLTAATTAVNSYQYRCVVSGTCTPAATSSAATLTINAAPVVTTTPVNSTICAGNNTSFSVTATGTAITYQWQVNNGSIWSNVTNTGIYTGATTNTLNLTAATASVNTYQYRCVVSGTCTPAATSAVATLTINTAPVVTVPPVNSTICENTNTNFTVTATGASLTYQWQEYDGSSWANIANTGIYSNATTGTLNLTGATTAVNGYQYRCVVGGTCVPGVTSAAATLIINTAPVVNAQPVNRTICELANTTFGITATGAGLSYQWQMNNGSSWSNVTNGGIYTGATTNTLNLTAATTAVHGYQYRCVVSGTCSPSTTSNAVTLNINTAPVVTTAPVNSTICSGNNTSFSIAATGTNITYQWQVNNGSSWANLSNTGIYSGATTNTLNLTAATTVVHTYQYRCVVSGTCTPSATSTAATLTINTSPVVTTQPVNRTICELTNTTFGVTVTGAGLTYQWQVNNGSSWSNISNTGIYSGATTATLNLTAATTAVHTYQYRCVVSGTCTPSVTSNAAIININNAPVVTTQPVNSTICSGNNTSFSIAATGTTITYQWQVYNGSTWSNITNTGIYTGATTNTLNLTGATTSIHNYQYRCVVSGACAPAATSSAATMIINTAPTVTLAPVNRTICENTNTTFSVTSTGTALTYQWQVNNGTAWTNITNTGIYSNATTNTLNLTAATTAVDGYQYRCVLNGTCTPSVTTAPATLTINTAPVITMQPTNNPTCLGSNTSFSVTVTGTAPTYQWQVSTNGGSTFTNITNGGIYSNTTTATLNLTSVTNTQHNYQYRCVVSGSCSPAATSTAAVLTINQLPTVTTHPVTGTILCAGANTSYSVTATGTALTYQWQASSNGTAWVTLSNNSNYSGATAATLNITGVNAGMNGFQYRCVVSGACAPSVSSNSGTLEVRTPPVLDYSPANTAICEGQNVAFVVNATGSLLTYQWQLSTNGGSSWSNLSNTGLYSGVTTQILTMNNVPVSYNAYRYRCVINGYCTPSIVSAGAILTVNTDIVITSQPTTNITICSGDNASFSLTATGTGATYQWYRHTGGTNFVPLTNGGVYSGVTTNTLNITGMTAPTATVNNTYHCIVTGTCSFASTNTLHLTVNARPAISSNPASVTVCDSTQYIDFTVAATATNISYQWQLNTGSGWVNLSNNSTYNNVTYPTMRVAQALLSMTGYQYRCVVSGTCTPTATSAPATLTVNPLVRPTVSITGNTNICAGQTVTLTASTTNAGSSPSYQWLKNNVPVGTGSSYTFGGYVDLDYVQCKMTSSVACPSPAYVWSSQVSIRVIQYVAPAIYISSGLSGDSACSSRPVTFKVDSIKNGGTAPAYQWKINGANVGTNSTTFTTTTLQDNDVVTCQLISNVQCLAPAIGTSNALQMTVNPTRKSGIEIYVVPDSVICAEQEVLIYAVFAIGGYNPTIQWMRNSVDIAGETDGKLRISTLNDNDIISCKFNSSEICVFPDTSNEITFEVTPLTDPSVNVAVSFNGGNSYTFTATPINGGTNPTYQWFNDFYPIPGATSNVYTSDTLKNSNVIHVEMMSSVYCPRPSLMPALSRYTSTAVSEVKSTFSYLELYPNPNRGSFTIKGDYTSTTNADVEINIINSLGQSLYKTTGNVKGGKLEQRIELNTNVPAGVYIIQVFSNGKKEYRRFNIIK